MKAQVVIGAGFGDEGKGKMVDYLASRTTDAVVVRCNGGAQAAHTVQVDGERTVFHHVGSGHLAGADTFLAKEFIVNPIMFCEEIQRLPKGGKVVCHPECRVTTPYDMMYNQALEMSRGDGKHGSCGLGINATVDRHEEIPFYAWQLGSGTVIEEILEKCRDRFLRLVKEQNINIDFLSDALETEPPYGLTWSFIEDCMWFAQEVKLGGTDCLIGRNIIFEMAQGLLLDEHHKWFPYVTRSRTGLDNVLDIVNKVRSITELEVTYMTRAYMTRHGAGPFPTERGYQKFTDETNLFNRWQGHLRFGDLDLNLLFDTIQRDFNKAYYLDIPVTRRLCVTCMDQMMNGGILFEQGSNGRKDVGYYSAGDFLEHVGNAWQGELLYSMGPERREMRTWGVTKKRMKASLK